jgi:hypothetical protein
MEDFSRRALVALVVAAAGPTAAMLTLLLVAPALVASSAPATDGGIIETTGSLLVGLFVGGLLAGVAAYVVGAVATLAALVATTCPRPYVAWLACLVLAPPWMSALSMLDLDVAGFLVLSGLLPGVVRLGFGYLDVPNPCADVPVDGAA